jgi:NhaP-type Na+/H+ and K+/H+ antiporter
MEKFRTFNDFLTSLTASIDTGKDVYVFGSTNDDETDYQLFEEKNVYHYYVTFCLDFNKLQEVLHTIYNYEEDESYIIVNDLCNVETEDGLTQMKRMHIFKTP